MRPNQATTRLSSSRLMGHWGCTAVPARMAGIKTAKSRLDAVEYSLVQIKIENRVIGIHTAGRVCRLKRRRDDSCARIKAITQPQKSASKRRAVRKWGGIWGNNTQSAGDST